MTIEIERGFVRLSHGLVHYRSAGTDTDQPPILMLHGGPGSSASLLPLVAALADRRRIIAPDTAGSGQSDALVGDPTIARYAETVAEFLDRLGMPLVDLYGHHTGAQIGCELSILAHTRVRRAVLDGAALFPPDLRAEFRERYAPRLEPAADGGHLMWLWSFADRLTRYFPHYRADEAHRIVPGAVLPPASITAIVAEILQAWPTWHLAYDAAFAHDLAARLPLMATPALVLQTAGDPLAIYAERAAELLSYGEIAAVSRDDKQAVIAAFLNRSPP